jgi:hypothetical protein
MVPRGSTRPMRVPEEAPSCPTIILSDVCRFEFAGTINADALDATFEPTACPGGAGGTWSATRTSPTSNASTRNDAATFDDGAAFDAARFR